MREKIGQLIMVATRSDQGEGYYKRFDFLIQNYGIGGLIFFQGSPFRQANLYNRYQSVTKVPLLVGIDGEWGLGMRLDSVADFPRQMTLGALTDERLIYRMGIEIGRQFNLLGVHVNFAPVADINESPRNPVIGIRSFGENRENVTQKSLAYMNGLQAQNIIATGKHFPGHGNTIADSHFTLPVVSDDLEHIQTSALPPFKTLINKGLTAILTAHLQIPALDNTPRTPSSLSPKVVTDLLKKELKFEGLVFTDAMNMAGVSQGRTAVEANIQALLAGNDILLYPENVAATIEKIVEQIEQKIISEEIINEKVKKVLLAKSWVGLDACQSVNTEKITQKINSREMHNIVAEIAKNATTLLKNSQNLLPLEPNQNYVSVVIDEKPNNSFQKTLGNLGQFKDFTLANQPYSAQSIDNIVANIDSAQTVVLSIHDRRKSTLKPFIISSFTNELIQKLHAKNASIVLCLFASPYSLSQLPDVEAVVCGYENLEVIQSTIAQQLFGGLPFRGKLPVSVENKFPMGHFVTFEPKRNNKLIFGLPEQVGMSSQTLAKIDSLANRSIQQKVFPGCQVVVARKGRLVYQKSFGKLSYDAGSEAVTNQTIYDLASVTKVSATLQAVMMLYEKGKIGLKQKAAFYLPELQNSNKKDVTIEDLLLHRSGMVSFYPALWEHTITKGGGLKAEWYSSVADGVFSLPVAPKLFAKPALADTVWKMIVASPLHGRKEGNRAAFVYSDLGLVVLQKVIEKIVNQPLNEFLEQNLYSPIAMRATGYKPLDKWPVRQIAPTENDYRFRNQLLQGTVHDQMAAVLGGVAGHAGLFSNASDLAILMQMQLNGGSYGGRKYLETSTIETFTKLYDTQNHRGLGWDKAPKDANESNYVAASTSSFGFGHSGFTGTMVWADPESELVFVFLSNRVNPRADNNSLNHLKIRKQMHEVVYKAITK